MAKTQTTESLPEELERELESLRSASGLRALTDDESGTGIHELPAGTYGFTYSACEDNFPLFNDRDLRSFEGHKLPDASVVLLGFLTQEESEALSGSAAATIHLFPEPKGEARHLARVPLARVQSHVESSARTGKGLELRLRPKS